MSVPEPQAIAVMTIALAAFYLYTRPQIRMEMVALLLLLSLALLFHFFPVANDKSRIDDTIVLSGFGHPVLIAILCLMILGRGLSMTGALEPIARLLTGLWKMSPRLGLLLTLLVGAIASTFINDTPVLVMMLPMLLRISEHTGISDSKTLMPVNFAILGGGMVTSIGTSTNLLIISIATELGVKPIGLFDFTSISLSALFFAILYLWLVAPRLLPDRPSSTKTRHRLYEAILHIEPTSPWIGRSVLQASRALGRPLPLIHIVRAGQTLDADSAVILSMRDELVIADTPSGLREIAMRSSAVLYDSEGLGHFVPPDDSREDHGVVELVIGPKSPLCGSTLGDARFADHFGLIVIALHRTDTDLLRTAVSVGTTVLQSGDLLLAQGPETRIEAMRGKWDLMLLDSKLVVPRTALAPWALAIMAAVVLISAVRILPIHIAAMLGVAAMLWKGCVRFEGVGRALSLQVVLLVASSIALGLSMVGSGAADWLASVAVTGMVGLPAAVQVAAIMSLSAVLTNFVSNSAAAAIGTPIAVAMAAQLALPAEPFVLAILFGANLSYATPMAYQTNLLVMHAAGYRFADFARVGLPLVLLMLVVLSVLLVRHYAL